jgi:hypothetical protein
MASVPVELGLGWFYGNGHFDQINHVLLAEFLKEEPYGTGEQQIGLVREWSDLSGLTIGPHRQELVQKADWRPSG